MKTFVIAVACLLIASSPLFGQKNASAPMTDQQFVNFAAQTDMVEANLGQLAESVGSSQGVKDSGQMLVTDHTSDYQQLSKIASSANLNVPSAIDDKHNHTLIDPLHKLTGAAFDHQYISDMVAGHTQAIGIYKKEAEAAQNPDLKSYAEETLSVLQKHLSAAQDLKNSSK